MNDSAHDDRIHLRVWELLPWIVNQTASASEQAEVNEHLPHCEACRAELEYQQRLSKTINTGGDTVHPDVEAGLANLSQRIDAPRTVPRSRLLALSYGLAALLVLETGSLAVLGMRLGDNDRTAAYRTLSSGGRAAERATVRLVIDPAMPVGRLQELLAALGLQIVGGPSESGVYSLGPRLVEAGRTALKADVNRQVEALRAAPEVRFVEPVVHAGDGA